MKLCPSCNASVPESLLVEDHYTSYARAGEDLKREVCVLCQHYLPIHWLSCYDVSSGNVEYSERVKDAIRRLFAELLDAQGSLHQAALQGRVGPLARSRRL